jgi:hypothetical protein
MSTWPRRRILASSEKSPWWSTGATISASLFLLLIIRPSWAEVPRTIANDEGSSPRHQFVFQSFINLPKKLEFDQTYRYVSALPIQVIASYSTMDARFAWHFTSQLEFSVAGHNLLQPNHAEFGGDPGGLVGIKRNVYAKLVWSPKKN